MNKALALVVEDSYHLAELFAHALTEAGFETEIIDDGLAALERLREVIPAIVLLDLNLPGASGETILRYMHGDARLAQTRTLIATANGTHASQLDDSADLVFIKPVAYRQLRDLSSRLHPNYQV